MAKRSDPHERVKRAFHVIMWLTVCIVGTYMMLFRMRGEWDENIGGRPYITNYDLVDFVCLAYLFIIMFASAVHYLLMNRSYNCSKIDPANEVTAEGIVYSSEVMTGGRYSRKAVRHNVLVAVRGLDKLLRGRPVIRGETIGSFDPATWDKGDRVTVIYDRTDPRVCRILWEETDVYGFW